MNDKVYNLEINRLFRQLNLPENLSYEQMQEIAMYAAYKLEEQKKRKEKIIFNPTETGSTMTSQPLKSDANVSHQKYKMSNRKKA
jgi:hypothetical protein